MTDTFKAILVSRGEDKKQSVAVRELTDADLMEGDVTVAVEWTTVNYKDGLAITGKAPVVRRFPLVPGIDFAGTVISSEHPILEEGRQGHPQRLGCGRDAFRRLCRPRAGKRRLAGAFARRHDGARGDGRRHGGLHRDAFGYGAGTSWHHTGSRTRRRHWGGWRSRLRSDRRAVAARLPCHRFDRASGRKRLSDRSGRCRNHRPQRAVGTGEATGQGALGGWRRCCRQSHARQCLVDDILWRRGFGLRIGAGHGSAIKRGAVHPARRVAARYRFRHGAAADTFGGLAAR